jgi:hypothetical protein
MIYGILLPRRMPLMATLAGSERKTPTRNIPIVVVVVVV